MSVPSENQLFERLEFNLDYYKVNYIVAYGASLLLVCIVRPLFFFVALPLVISMGFYLSAVRDAPIFVAGSPLTNRQVSTAYLSLSAIILIVFGNLPLLLSLLSVTLCVIVHAIARERGLFRKAKIAVNKYLPSTKLDKAYAFLVATLDHAFVREPTAHSPYKAVGSRAGYDAVPEADVEGGLRALDEDDDKADLRNLSSEADGDEPGPTVVRRGSHGERTAVYTAPPSTHAQGLAAYPTGALASPGAPTATHTISPAANDAPTPFLGGSVPSMLSPQANRYALSSPPMASSVGATLGAPVGGFSRYMDISSVNSTISNPSESIQNQMSPTVPSGSSNVLARGSFASPPASGAVRMQQNGPMYGPTRGFNTYMDSPPSESQHAPNFLQKMKAKYGK